MRSTTKHAPLSFSLLAVMLAAGLVQAGGPEGFPTFSWDTVPLYAHFQKPDDLLTERELEFVVGRYPIIALEKAHARGKYSCAREAQYLEAARIKRADPDVKVLYYWNSSIAWPFTDAVNEEFAAHPDWALRKRDGELQLRGAWKAKWFDKSIPELRRWWTDEAARAISEGHCDGVFMDAATLALHPANKSWYGPEKAGAIERGGFDMMRATKEKMGPGKLLVFNGIRTRDEHGRTRGMELLPYADGVCLEHFDHFGSTSKESIASDLEMVSEAAGMGKIVIFKAWPGFSWLDRDMPAKPREELSRLAAERITFPLACYLIAAGEFTYFCYSWGYELNDGFLDWYPEYDKPLGRPLEDAERDGGVYTRRFEHAAVRVDVENKQATIDWK